MGSKPQNIYLFQLNDSIKWTPAMFLAWITVLRGTHKWSTVTPSCSPMYQIQCLPRVQCLSQMWKLFVLVNKLNFTATLSFYHTTGILRGGCCLSWQPVLYWGLPKAKRRCFPGSLPSVYQVLDGPVKFSFWSRGAWLLHHNASPRETCFGARVSGVVLSGPESWLQRVSVWWWNVKKQRNSSDLTPDTQPTATKNEMLPDIKRTKLCKVFTADHT